MTRRVTWAAPVWAMIAFTLAATGAWARPGEVTLVAVGDIMLARGVAKQAARLGWDYPFARTVETIRAADIAVGNLECVLGEQGVVVPKRFSFSAPEAAAAELKRAGFDVLFLANNHTFDRGRAGLTRTTELLRRQGIAFAGAGPSLQAACAPVVVERNGLKVAFLSFSDWTPENYLTVPDRPSVALAEPETIRSSIREARRRADVVVVSFHWGIEHSARPSVSQRRLARLAVDAGADIVLGHHPHIRQPVRRLRGRPIVYSLGNFVFDQRSPGLSNGWMVVARLSRTGVKVTRLGAVEIRSCQPRVRWTDRTAGHARTSAPSTSGLARAPR